MPSEVLKNLNMEKCFRSGCLTSALALDPLAGQHMINTSRAFPPQAGQASLAKIFG